MKSVIVTGAAGFIGSSVVARLLQSHPSVRIVGIDNISDYYDVRLKHARLERLSAHPNAASYRFETMDFQDLAGLTKLMTEEQPDVVIHLGAQASVRYGLKNPLAYLNSNLIGHFNIIEAIRISGAPVQHLLYASSSSVYGANEKVPFEETDDVSRPQSLYAATKKANELITHSWSNQFKLPATGLRFFTVYGPWGRPDMSPMIFASSILNKKPIPLFNSGDLWRDFTYIDDIVEAIIRLIPAAPTAEQYGGTPHVVFNLGNQNPVRMTEFVTTLATAFGEEAIIDNLPWPPTEVYKTFADTTSLQKAIGWSPSTPLAEGLKRFAEWYRPHHGQITI